MKKLRLKKGVKIFLTLLTLVISIIIYSKMGYVGSCLQQQKGYELICILGWTWLIFGQTFIYCNLWEE